MAAVCLVLALVILITGVMAPVIYQKIISVASVQAMNYQSYIDAIRGLIQKFF